MNSPISLRQNRTTKMRVKLHSKASPATLCLASQSLARRRLVKKLLRSGFTNYRLKVVKSLADERAEERKFRREFNLGKQITRRDAKKMAQRLADVKRAQAIVPRNPDTAFEASLVIGCDQLLFFPQEKDGRGVVLGKPGTHSRARTMLRKLSGRKAYLITAMSISRGHKIRSFTQVIELQFAMLSRAEIEEVLLLDRPYGAAGSFLFEAHGANLFESVKSDDPTGIQGISVMRLRRVLTGAYLFSI